MVSFSEQVRSEKSEGMRVFLAGKSSLCKPAGIFGLSNAFIILSVNGCIAYLVL